MLGRQSGSEEGKKLICFHFSGMPFIIWGRESWYHHFSYILIIFFIKIIIRVAWKANKVSDGSHLLDLIKNRGQLNCRAVVLCWPVIALETGDDIVGGTGIAVQFLPNNVYPLSVDFANFLSKLFFFKSQCVQCSPFNCTVSTLPSPNLSLSPSRSAFVAFFKWNSAEILSEPRMFIWNLPPVASLRVRLHLYDNVSSF